MKKLRVHSYCGKLDKTVKVEGKLIVVSLLGVVWGWVIGFVVEWV